MRPINANWLGELGGKRLVLSLFRTMALTAAILELTLSENEFVTVPWAIPVTVAAVYTVFKLLHPLSWYAMPHSNAILSTLDVAVSASLIAIPGHIHAPFAMYTLVPVLTAALLSPAKPTMLIAGVTASYYAIFFFSHPFPVAAEFLNSLFIYLSALTLTATLPYIVNSEIKRQLQFKGMHQERLRLGREIHDGLCQTFYGLRWELQALSREASVTSECLTEKITKLEKLLQEADVDARGSIELLRSGRPDRPLLGQLQDFLEALGDDRGIECRLESDGKEPNVYDAVKLEVLYICKEALNNVAKHAGARHVKVAVRTINESLQISIVDDGRGFSGSFTDGRGLSVMKERAEAIGGRFKLLSVPAIGTEIQLEVPRKCYPEPKLPNK